LHLTIGYFSNVENCRPATACVVDMYIDDKANLPWNNKARYASMYGRKSKGILRSQYPKNLVDRQVPLHLLTHHPPILVAYQNA
jgi:hypothetical protein